MRGSNGAVDCDQVWSVSYFIKVIATRILIDNPIYISSTSSDRVRHGADNRSAMESLKSISLQLGDGRDALSILANSLAQKMVAIEDEVNELAACRGLSIIPNEILADVLELACHGGSHTRQTILLSHVSANGSSEDEHGTFLARSQLKLLQCTLRSMSPTRTSSTIFCHSSKRSCVTENAGCHQVCMRLRHLGRTATLQSYRSTESASFDAVSGESRTRLLF